MIEHIAYLAALNATEIVDTAADVAGSLVESTGRSLATGLCDELESRVKAARSLGSLISVVAGGAGDIVDTLKSAVEPALAKALHSEGVTVVSQEELMLLCEVAAQVATGADTSKAIKNLKAYHATKKTAGKA